MNCAQNELSDANDRCKALISEKQTLINQLAAFEKDSFEIQARVKHGLESEQTAEALGLQVAALKDKERLLQR